MRARRIAWTLSAVGAGIALGIVGAAACQPALADSTTTVIEGQVLRLESTADWDAASAMVPGRPVDWDISIGSRVPSGGTVLVSLRAVGDAPLVADARLCSEEWGPSGCRGTETLLRAATDLADDSIISLATLPDTATAHLRLSVVLRAPSVGSTQITVGASTGDETVSVRSDGRGELKNDQLARTGGDAAFAWALGAASALLVVLGVLLLRSRRSRGDEGEEEQER